jgi:hypothetical protein
VTVHNDGPPEVTLLVHGDSPAAAWSALEAWAARYGNAETAVRPATGDGHAYAYAEFARSGVRVHIYAIIEADTAQTRPEQAAS